MEMDAQYLEQSDADSSVADNVSRLENSNLILPVNSIAENLISGDLISDDAASSMLNSTSDKNARNAKNSVHGSSIILRVDHTRFVVQHADFIKYPNTMLGRMFTSGLPMTKPNADGEFEVADGISRDVFEVALEFYKFGKIAIPANVSVADVREACNYLMIPFEPKQVECQDLCGILHEVSNDGARKQFKFYLEILLYPAMLASAERGDRQCHIVVLMEDDEIMWSSDYPPQMGEEYFQVVASSSLNRFLKYLENREVAKQVLKDRGLKKITCGLEHYPTTIDKIRRRAGGRVEGIYNYIQRPFIELSWQKEETKSRRVNFSSVKSKSVSSLAEANADPDLNLTLNGSSSLVRFNQAAQQRTSVNIEERLMVQMI